MRPFSASPYHSLDGVSNTAELIDMLWSQYSVEAGRIIPLQAASFARRDLAFAFLHSLMLGLLLLTLTVIALVAMPILRRLASG